VAIIGNGASGIQILPSIQPAVAGIDHYVRSKTWIATSWVGDERTFESQQLTEEQLASFKDPEMYLHYRKSQEEKYWRGFRNVFRSSDLNIQIQHDSIKIMEKRLSAKPELLPKILPDFPPGCRHLTPGPGYLEALCANNVNYIDTPIEIFTPTGIKTSDGVHREVDAVFCATGANIDGVPRFDIIARGVDIREAWAPGGKWGFPYTYQGLATPRYPNLLWILGAHGASPSGTTPHAVEIQLTYFAKPLRKVSSQGIKAVEPLTEAADDSIEFANSFFETTVFTENCKSWANSGNSGSFIHAYWPGSASQWE